MGTHTSKLAAMGAGGNNIVRDEFGTVTLPNDLPQLQGTEKQIAWAEEIRAKLPQVVNDTYGELIERIQKDIDADNEAIQERISKGKEPAKFRVSALEGHKEDMEIAIRERGQIQNQLNKFVSRATSASGWIDRRQSMKQIAKEIIFDAYYDRERAKEGKPYLYTERYGF